MVFYDTDIKEKDCNDRKEWNVESQGQAQESTQRDRHLRLMPTIQILGNFKVYVPVGCPFSAHLALLPTCYKLLKQSSLSLS